MNDFVEDISDLIRNLVVAFQKNKHDKKISDRITRGRAPSLSNLFENQLAIFIEKNTPDELKLYVDTPFSYTEKNRKRKKTIYPDIAIIKNKQLIGVFEVKIDLGYYNFDWPKNRKQLIQQLIEVGELFLNKNKISVKNPMCINIILSGKNHRERIPHFIKNVENPIILIKKENIHPNNNIIDLESYIDEVRNTDNILEWRKLHLLLRELGSF